MVDLDIVKKLKNRFAIEEILSKNYITEINVGKRSVKLSIEVKEVPFGDLVGKYLLRLSLVENPMITEFEYYNNLGDAIDTFKLLKIKYKK